MTPLDLFLVLFMLVGMLFTLALATLSVVLILRCLLDLGTAAITGCSITRSWLETLNARSLLLNFALAAYLLTWLGLKLWLPPLAAELWVWSVIGAVSVREAAWWARHRIRLLTSVLSRIISAWSAQPTTRTLDIGLARKRV